MLTHENVKEVINLCIKCWKFTDHDFEFPEKCHQFSEYLHDGTQNVRHMRVFQNN
jgi:hypothetical protein